MNGLSDNQIHDLLWRDRPMVVVIDGIWRSVEGRYIHPLKEPWTAKIILNGREYIVQYFLDFNGCNKDTVREEVVIRNIQSLPPPPKRKKLLNINRAPREIYNQARPGFQWALRMKANGVGTEPYEIPIPEGQPGWIGFPWVDDDPFPINRP